MPALLDSITAKCQVMYHWIEEYSRLNKSGTGKCVNIFVERTLADQSFFPFPVLLANPIIAIAIVLVIQLLFTIVYLPFKLLCLLVTPYVAWVLLLGLIFYGIRFIAKSIAFPASNATVQKDISASLADSLTQNFENIATHTADLSAALLLFSSGQLADVEFMNIARKYVELNMMINSIVNPVACLKLAVTTVQSYKLATSEELVMMKNLVESLSQLLVHWNALSLIVPNYFKSVSLNPRSRIVSFDQEEFESGGGGSGQQRNDTVPIAASRCLQASEMLKISAQVARPNKGGESEESRHPLMKLLCSCLNKSAGMEKVSFPYMRSVLQQKWSAKQFTVLGKNKNKISAVLIPAMKITGGSGRSMPAGQASGGAEQAGVGLPPAAQPGSTDGSRLADPTTRPASGLKSVQFSKKGMVLFCGPNAGLWECLAQADIRTSWLGLYTSLGYDVCMYNYRGYGLSSGSPSPRAIRDDGLSVLEHVRKEQANYYQNNIMSGSTSSSSSSSNHSTGSGTQSPSQPALPNAAVPKLVIHGESIGGMAACYIARHARPAPDMLVCDRTFASLDAVATRLMGAWAGNSLRYLAWWETNVAKDYIACTCPKIVLQDPNDHIIAHCGSLKNGLATHLQMGENVWAPKKEPREYLLARYLKQPLPFSDISVHAAPSISSTCANMLADVRDARKPLSMAFVYHFHACLVEVSKLVATQNKQVLQRSNSGGKTIPTISPLAPRGATLESVLRSRNSGIDSDSAAGDNESGVEDDDDDDIEMGAFPISRGGAALTRTSSLELYSGRSAAAVRAHANSSCTSSNAGQNHLLGSGLKANSLTAAFGDLEASSGSGSGSGITVGGSKAAAGGNSSGAHGVGGDNMTNIRAAVMSSIPSGGSSARLEEYCKQSITDETKTPLARFSLVMSRIDNGSGVLLGHAVKAGVDHVCSWVCAAVVWQQGYNSFFDASMPANASSLAQARRDLIQLVDELYPSQLKSYHEVQFLQCAILSLLQRCEAESGSIVNCSSSSSSSSSYSGHIGGDSLVIFPKEEHLYSSVTLHEGRQTHPSSCLGQVGRIISGRSVALLNVASNMPTAPSTPTAAAAASSSSSSIGASSRETGVGTVALLSPSCRSAPGRARIFMKRTGALVTVRCGHNGWPAQDSLRHIFNAFQWAGLIEEKDWALTMEMMFGRPTPMHAPPVYQD